MNSTSRTLATNRTNGSRRTAQTLSAWRRGATRLLGSLILLVTSGLTLPHELAASEPTSTSEVLLKATTSWNGQPFDFPDGTAEVTSVRITLNDGAQTPWHCHAAPMFAYIISGAVEVQTVDDQSRVFRAGESLVEVWRTWHRGRAVDGAVEIVVFFAGTEGVAPTVTAPGETQPSADQACDSAP